MNSEPDYHIDPELEAQIVAYVHGESSDVERIERLIGEDAKVGNFYTEMIRVDSLLNDSKESDWKVSRYRREKMLKAFETAPAKPKSLGLKWVLGTASAAAALFFVGFLLISEEDVPDSASEVSITPEQIESLKPLVKIDDDLEQSDPIAYLPEREVELSSKPELNDKPGKKIERFTSKPTPNRIEAMTAAELEKAEGERVEKLSAEVAELYRKVVVARDRLLLVGQIKNVEEESRNLDDYLKNLRSVFDRKNELLELTKNQPRNKSALEERFLAIDIPEKVEISETAADVPIELPKIQISEDPVSLQSQLVSLKSILSDLENKIGLTYLNVHTSTLTLSRAKLEKRKSETEELLISMAKIDTEFANVAEPEPIEAASHISAKVTKVYEKWGFILIDSGRESGLASGDLLTVARNDKTIAHLKIKEAGKGESSAEILKVDLPIRAGDRVVKE